MDMSLGRPDAAVSAGPGMRSLRKSLASPWNGEALWTSWQGVRAAERKAQTPQGNKKHHANEMHLTSSRDKLVNRGEPGRLLEFLRFCQREESGKSYFLTIFSTLFNSQTGWLRPAGHSTIEANT